MVFCQIPTCATQNQPCAQWIEHRPAPMPESRVRRVLLITRSASVSKEHVLSEHVIKALWKREFRCWLVFAYSSFIQNHESEHSICTRMWWWWRQVFSAFVQLTVMSTTFQCVVLDCLPQNHGVVIKMYLLSFHCRETETKHFRVGLEKNLKVKEISSITFTNIGVQRGPERAYMNPMSITSASPGAG